MAQTKIERANLATTGTPDGSKFLRDDMAWTGAGGGFIKYTVFTGSQSYTFDSDTTKAIIEVQGAGGSGTRNTYGHTMSNGSAGGYARKFINAASLGTGGSITVGAGGPYNGDGYAGSDGTDSVWDDTGMSGSSTITGGKGTGGGVTSYFTALGGVASGGDLHINGDVAFFTAPHVGSHSFLGKGGCTQTNGTHNSPTGYGGGGGGGTASIDGTAGGNGVVIVWEYK